MLGIETSPSPTASSLGFLLQTHSSITCAVGVSQRVRNFIQIFIQYAIEEMSPKNEASIGCLVTLRHSTVLDAPDVDNDERDVLCVPLPQSTHRHAIPFVALFF